MKEFNYNDMMDSALAPIEAQRDDALDELFKVKAENAELLAALETMFNAWIQNPGRLPSAEVFIAAEAAIDKAKA